MLVLWHARWFTEVIVSHNLAVHVQDGDVIDVMVQQLGGGSAYL